MKKAFVKNNCRHEDFKKRSFGHYLLIKRWLIQFLGAISHRRYQGFNSLQIEGSEVIRELKDKNVLFVSNHQTYFADVTAMHLMYLMLL